MPTTDVDRVEIGSICVFAERVAAGKGCERKPGQTAVVRGVYATPGGFDLDLEWGLLEGYGFAPDRGQMDVWIARRTTVLRIEDESSAERRKRAIRAGYVARPRVVVRAEIG